MQVMEVVVIVLGSTVVVVVLLLFVVLEIASRVGKRRALQTFVPVEAVVVSQKLIERDNYDSRDYRPAIEYEYAVEGSLYRSTTIWSGTAGVRSYYHFSLKNAQHLLEQYPVGQTVPAFRDPADPTQAFLIRKHPFLHEHLLTIFWGGFGLLIVFGYAFGFALEAGILSLLGVVKMTHSKLPAHHDALWDSLHEQASKLSVAASVGVGIGMAYHLLVDGLVQPAPYHDLPIAMPIEAHQSVFVVNGLGEAIDIGKKRQI